jgi:hypothetical protein
MAFNETSLAAVIEQVRAIMGNIAHIGQVHPYIRFANTEAGMQDKFKDPEGNPYAATGGQPDRIKFWSITRSSTQSVDKNVSANMDVHTLTIRGWMSLDDANNSELEFQGLVELVRQTFKGNRKLNGTAFYSAPMQAPSVMSGAIGGFVVHYAELTLQVQVYPIDF